MVQNDLKQSGMFGQKSIRLWKLSRIYFKKKNRLDWNFLEWSGTLKTWKQCTGIFYRSLWNILESHPADEWANDSVRKAQEEDPNIGPNEFSAEVGHRPPSDLALCSGSNERARPHEFNAPKIFKRLGPKLVPFEMFIFSYTILHAR